MSRVTAVPPPLRAGSVHVWALPDDVDRPDLLAADELESMRRLRGGADRRRFVARRAGLRQVMAVYTGIEPEALVFERSCQRCGHPAHGRPRLATTADLSFSTSSRPGVAVVAVAVARMSVGVDVELIAGVDRRALHQIGLTPDERAAVSAAGPSADVQLWCRKEAVLKAQGLGLGGPSPASLDVRPPVVAGWYLTDLPGCAGWVGAVATAEPVAGLFLPRRFDVVSQGQLGAQRGHAR